MGVTQSLSMEPGCEGRADGVEETEKTRETQAGQTVKPYEASTGDLKGRPRSLQPAQLSATDIPFSYQMCPLEQKTK